MRNDEMNAGVGIIADLNDLLQLDHDAVEAYTIAIDLARGDQIRRTLVEYRADHKRHIEELGGLIRARGGLPTELPHATGPLKLAVQAVGGVMNDDALLLAFKAVEGQVVDSYVRTSNKAHPTEVADVIRRATEDERKHYAWVESTLRVRGLGHGTLPHALAAAVESVHKILANPIERVQRDVMEQVGKVVGTTNTRGGSEAPSPGDIVGGVVAGANRRNPEPSS